MCHRCAMVTPPEPSGSPSAPQNTCSEMVETMGLEPTTPCLQTKMSRTRGDADRQKGLVKVGVLRCVDPLGRPRMFPKCSLVASRACYHGVKRQPAGGATESGPVTHCLQVANAVGRLKDGPVIPQRSPASSKPSDGKAGHPGRKPEPFDTSCQADYGTVGEGDQRCRWVRPRARRVVSEGWPQLHARLDRLQASGDKVPEQLHKAFAARKL
jgi:hypothetical protein